MDECKRLLVELQEYIVSIDRYGLNTISPDYKDKYFDMTYDITYSNAGKIYLAVEDSHVVGMVAGHIRQYDITDRLDYICPRMGVVQELVVTHDSKGSGIGKKLMSKIESYFKEQECLYSTLEVFAYNDSARRFYERLDYSDRLVSMIKKF